MSVNEKSSFIDCYQVNVNACRFKADRFGCMYKMYAPKSANGVRN